MHDREFTKPYAMQLKTGSAERPTFEYTFEAYIGEFIWSFSKWNTEEGWDEAQIRLGEAIEECACGGVVQMSLDDWEKLREANKEAQIKGPQAHKIRKFQRAIKSATKPVSVS